MDAAETRFAHLLQPIRDLTKNWEVDVASQLAEYLDELDKICISFDEGKTTMNFAEAALLIQSSACIYSKKVEYLYSLVYQALDLISKKKRDKQPSSVRQDGADNDVTFGNKKHKVEFLTLDDISEMNSPNSEMKKDTADGLEIISLTPGPLIPAEEQDKRKNPLYSFRGEVLASCKDFRINNFTPHSSGIIRLDSLSTPSQFLRDLPARQPAFDVSSTVPVDFNCHGVPLPPLRLSEAPDGDGSIEVQDAANEDGAFLPLEDGGMELEQQAVIHMDRHQATHERRVLREQPEAQRTPEEYKELPDPWRWLDPYSALGDKPIKTGKHFTIPRGVQDISGNKRKRKALAKLQDFTSWFNGTLSEASNRKPKRGPTFAGLEDLYWSCMKERLKMQRTFHRKAGIFSCRDTFMEKSLELGGAERQAEEEEEAQPEAFWDNNAVDDLSDHNIYPDEAPFQDLEQQDLLTASRTDRMSYEDLVRKNVELFLVNSQKYAQETVLSRRVKDWEEKISPQLKLQEERLVFNIHDYGNQVVDTFSSIGQTRSFASVVHGKESHEVCRYLLASLQLANDYTIEIHQEEGLEEAIDTMTLTLLSKQRAHERFKTYTAPSVAPGGTFLLPAERSPGVSSHAKAPVASTAQTERHRTKTTFWNRRIRDVTKASPTSSNAHTDHHGGLAAAVCSQDECTTTSCHPQLGDLMVGRGGRLSATSTCGLDGPQNYCIIGHLEDEKKCFSCDSRQPYNRYTNPRSHRIENVITTFDPKRRMKWWQSENGVHEVSIQLDLETVFQFSHLVLTFKSFRPSAMLVERSKDNGRTWTVFRYFAEDCGSSFPRVPAGAASSVGDVVCDTRYSGAEPSTGGEVVLKALDPSFQINDPYSPEIQELITMTNLRVNFTRLLTLGDALLGRRRRNPQDKYYYALYEMVVRGTCFCNGHASQCVPVDGTRGDVIVEPGMVHGHCVCQHNTAGNNCERCQDLYNDAPWRPAGHSNPHPCKKCNCNGHSERCHFDMARYISTGGVSGGVCDECGNNRVGVHCERCRASYYRDPQRAQNDLDACVPCNCDPFGSLDGGLCDPGTSRCICKRHVEGDRCDRCRYGFYGLSRDNPDGCTVCGCNPLGSVETPYPCDPVTGQCFCKPFATGPMCDRCLSGYWGLGNTVHSCSPCDCDIGGAQDSRCNPLDGQCRCRPNMVGPRCKDPAIGYFLAPLDFYLYEAEHAAPLQGSAQSLVNPTGLPRCEQFFRDQGYDFRLHNGNFILIKRTKRRGRQRRQEQTSIPLHPGLPLQIIPRQRIPGRPVTWTGPGFVRVQHGAGLRFTVNNLPVALDYYLVFRYEPESSDIWAAKVKVIPRTSLTKRRCANDPVDITVTLPGSSRMALLETPICLEDDALYYVDTIFEKQSNLDPQQSSHILIDSMGLIPRIESLLGFCSEMKLEEFEQYHCLEVASQLRPQILPEVCEDLIVSMSARIHNGAVACRCNPIGSHSQSCGKFGGQCDCKPSVIGRCCDTCAPHTFGFGPNGCTLCDCDPRGSVLEMCDQASGQCVCRPEVSGQRCDRCRPGYFGFPLCRPCQCNGLADLCDPVSGACVDCRNHAAGLHCDRCVDGYYGNLAFGEPCQPCLCPDTKASGRFFARSCSKDPNSLHVLCHCEPGHSGPRCDVCSPGFYGNLALPGAHCQECQCNSNIDPQDRGSCDPITGTCLRCLHHTYGSACESCEPGYYGDALAHNCRECRCDPQGTEANMCPTGGPCLCQQSSGQCPCQPGVAGTSCDECQQGFWGFTSEAGCQLCDCDPAWSLSDQCDKVTGQCPCHPEFGGRRCDECGENFFWSPDLQCISCDCNMDGTERPSCDHYTGKCLCRPGVVGSLCSECASGHGPPFPDCPICHDCWNLWAENVTVLQGQIERISTMVKQRDPQLHPSYSPWLDELDAMLDRIRNLIGDTTAETKMTEKLSEQIKTFRDTVDPHIIIIDTSPLLNTLIDNIRNEFHRLLGKLEKVKPNKYGDLKVLEEALRKIRKYHAEVKEAEEQCKDAKAMLAASRQKRQVAKDKLDSRLVEGWDTLERKVKALNVTSLYEDICGSPTCTASVLVGQNVTELPEQTKSDIARVLLSLSDSKRKIQEAKKKSQDTKSKAEELKKKIDKSLEKFEREKNKTKDLIKQVKEFLTDEMVRPEDIEMVVTAVLAIQLPSSPEEIGDLVNKIRSILVNSTKLLKDLEQLREEARTAQDLLQRAEEVRNKTRSIDVSEIKKAVKDAEKIQDNVSRYLVNAKNNITSTAKQLEEVKIDAKLNDTETLFNASRIKDLVEQVEALKNKTEMNRLQGQEAKAAADSALKNATATKMILDEVNTLFQELEKKKDNGTKELVDERLKNITMEAESIAKEVKDKMTQVEDLEKKIVQLLQVKNEKAVEVDELLQKVDDIRRELAERAVAYAKC